MRNKILYKYRGQDFTIDQLSAISGIQAGTLWRRINIWKIGVERAVTTPKKETVRKQKPQTIAREMILSFPATYRGLAKAGGA